MQLKWLGISDVTMIHTILSCRDVFMYLLIDYKLPGIDQLFTIDAAYQCAINSSNQSPLLLNIVNKKLMSHSHSYYNEMLMPKSELSSIGCCDLDSTIAYVIILCENAYHCVQTRTRILSILSKMNSMTKHVHNTLNMDRTIETDC